MKNFSAFTFSLLCFFSLSSKIITTDSIETVLEYTNKDTLVIYDIDNTIAKENNTTEWGSDQWLYAHVQNFIDHGLQPQKAWDLALPIYFEAQHSDRFALEFVTPNTFNVVKESQKKADKVIVLTARSYPLVQLTLSFLDNLGLNFLDNGFNEEFVFDKVPGKYTKGVFFCGAGNKGESLIELFKRINYWPKRVVFIDDKMKNVCAIENSLKEYDIEFIGMHYTYLEQSVKDFTLFHNLPEESFAVGV
jgi:FMN phosphatase YigB (HAD superfamily)